MTFRSCGELAAVVDRRHPAERSAENLAEETSPGEIVAAARLFAYKDASSHDDRDQLLRLLLPIWGVAFVAGFVMAFAGKGVTKTGGLQRAPRPLRVVRGRAVWLVATRSSPSRSPARRRAIPAQAIIAALSVQLASSGTTARRPCWAPSSATRRRSSLFAATPPPITTARDLALLRRRDELLREHRS